MTVRVRFAPSPTGELTAGGLRSSLFNWLFARHHGGTFILRIEDTDRKRLVPGSLTALLEAHRWLGLDWDEGPDVGGPYGPYIQSERLDRYQAAADRLVAAGHAYRCYCSEERLEAVRTEQRRRGRPTGYDRHCRALSPEERAAHEAAGTPFVVRFKMPLEGTTTFVDAIRGEISFDNARHGDLVLLKSDGFPTYHLAAIVDDIEMRITHVFRAEEWLPSVPWHVHLFRALGAERPVYAHLPLIVGKDRRKLSKRNGDASVRTYRDRGYLPDAMFNFLGLIGWSLDDHTTLITREQFIAHFDLDRVVRAPAQFDRDKLDWMNGEYIRRMPVEEFAALAAEWLERDLPPTVPRPIDRAAVRQIAPELQTRVKLLGEIAPLAGALFVPGPLDYDPALLLGRRGDTPAAVVRERLGWWREALAACEAWDRAALEALFDAMAARHGVRKGDLLMPLRVALTGSTVSLPMDVTLALLGRDRALARIDDALARVSEAGEQARAG
jgi:glutamyl-tRNA synthetase